MTVKDSFDYGLPPDEIVHRERGMFVLRLARLFGTGYNVYAVEDRGGETVGRKINPPMSYFSTLEAAVAFLREQSQ